MIEGLVSAATASDVDRRIVNVGSGLETTVNDLVALVEKAVGRDVDVIHSPAESGGVSRLRADIGLAQRLLGFDPVVGLEEGLRLTLKQDPRYQQ